MAAPQKLILIKSVHTLIWVFFNVVLAYLFFAAITNTIDHRFWIGIGIIVIEFLILLINRWHCPLTIVARQYSNSTRDNFDIYLPNWIAKNNKLIYSILMGILVLIYVYQQFS